MNFENDRKEIIPSQNSYDIELEKNNLKLYLKDNGMWVPEEFYSRIKTNDIIEVYQISDNKQIYANQQFSHYCSYSLQQMKTIPFPKLFWRTDEVHFKLMSRAKECSLKSLEVENWNIENHELVESLNPRKRTFEIKMGILAPCFSILSPTTRVALASTLQVQIIFEWPEDIRIEP